MNEQYHLLSTETLGGSRFNHPPLYRSGSSRSKGVGDFCLEGLSQVFPGLPPLHSDLSSKDISRGCPSPPELNQTHPHPSITVVQVHVLHSTYEYLKRVCVGGLSLLPPLAQAPESRGSLAPCLPTASQLWGGAQRTWLRTRF